MSMAGRYGAGNGDAPSTCLRILATHSRVNFIFFDRFVNASIHDAACIVSLMADVSFLNFAATHTSLERRESGATRLAAWLISADGREMRVSRHGSRLPATSATHIEVRVQNADHWIRVHCVAAVAHCDQVSCQGAAGRAL